MLHISRLGCESQFPIQIIDYYILKGITFNTHNFCNTIQVDARQGLIISTAYWMSICKVQGKRMIGLAKH
jgi:hypothetical protein